MVTTENRRPLKTRSKPWAQALAKFLVARKVQPNHISIAGIAFSIIGGVLLLLTQAWSGVFLFLAAALCIQLRLLCNLMDGLVAVEGGLKSNYGDLYNEIPDRVADAVLFICAGYAAGSGTTGWLCAVLAVFTAYLRVFGGALGQKQDFCGPMAKQQRMFLLTLGCLLASLNLVIEIADHALLVALWIIAAGAIATSVRRILRIAKNTLPRP
ncbi:MAG: CDP-alcohol phosphatidyltransferase family protein [Chthoniobacteraceae bacterium]